MIEFTVLDLNIELQILDLVFLYFRSNILSD